MTERFLVTGAGGCIGAWTVANLIEQGADVVAFDVADDDHRLRLVLSDGQLDALERRQGDIRDFDSFAGIVAADRITHIVHLAALQVPFCIADPILGSQVNVTGTVNVLEAARRSEGLVRGVTYASSIAVFGPTDMYPGGKAEDDSPAAPATLYGAYKQANEWTAKVYAADWGIGSVGLRPSIIYGPGRDQGLTSDPTKSMLAAAVGEGSHIGFGGSMTLQHASDAADYFIAAARLETDDALVHNISGPVATVEEIIGHIVAAAPEAEGRITFDEPPLPIVGDIRGGPLDDVLGDAASHKPLAEGIAETVQRFRELRAEGLV